MPPIENKEKLYKYTDVYVLSATGVVEKKEDTFDLRSWVDSNKDSVVLASDTVGNFIIETKFLSYNKDLEETKERFFETRVNHVDSTKVSSDITQKIMDELSLLYESGGNFATTKEEALLNHAKILALIT
jgi:hypothetical protein